MVYINLQVHVLYIRIHIYTYVYIYTHTYMHINSVRCASDSKHFSKIGECSNNINKSIKSVNRIYICKDKNERILQRTFR